MLLTDILITSSIDLVMSQNKPTIKHKNIQKWIKNNNKNLKAK